MKCLSVRQPFAWAILKGRKKVENRSRFPEFEGPILLHTGKVVEPMHGKFVDGSPIPPLDGLPTGAVVGAAVVVACWSWWMIEMFISGEMKVRVRSGSTFLEFPAGEILEITDGGQTKDDLKAIAADPFTNGPECILLDHVIEFSTPIPYSGQVGLFNVDEKKLPLVAADRKKLQQLVKKFK